MADLAQVWAEALPVVREGVTGVGVWTALNAVVPLAFEDGTFVVGLPHELGELSGHLRMPATKRLMEQTVGQMLNAPVMVRVIDGTSDQDWQLEKRRDAEKARLNDQALAKMRAEMAAKSNWESIYEQLGRLYASTSGKSLPQNRARFYESAVEMLADARRGQANFDDLGERNFARCLERLAQYAEIPSAIVAGEVLRRAGEL